MRPFACRWCSTATSAKTLGTSSMTRAGKRSRTGPHLLPDGRDTELVGCRVKGATHKAAPALRTLLQMDRAGSRFSRKPNRLKRACSCERKTRLSAHASPVRRYRLSLQCADCTCMNECMHAQSVSSLCCSARLSFVSMSPPCPPPCHTKLVAPTVAHGHACS